MSEDIQDCVGISQEESLLTFMALGILMWQESGA